ncbi:DUF456 domain-containing protein [Thermoflavimicrobium dichotomicum]|uniref:DUF456 domain-containing protein n=1 Tax=Thermoflavimicrobium dichotomicum TaxID=46223 RepID=A0A1I3RXK9_9BACL|nr:DUF456 family protein [Thermoflavimicrobium dichotomicum]SFJ50642.1 hypothetical protein SAMN05421852_11158 [Thermoflavimicrobium dichotomicum]
METIWWIIVIALFVLGYIGIILPVLPDMPFFWAGFVIYHFFIDKVDLGWGFWITVHSMTLLFILGDFVIQGYLTKKYGGSNISVWASIIGMIVSIPFGPIAIVLVPMALIFVIEMLLNKTAKEAFKISLSSIFTLIFSTLFKLVVVTGVLIWFAWKVV